MRLVLYAMGTRGDVYPMFGLALEAARRGHDALVAAPPDFGGEAARLGIEFTPLGDRSDELLARRNDVSMHAEQTRLHVLQLAEAARGAALVVGTGVPLSGPTAAEANECPYRYVAFAPEFVASTEGVPPLFPLKNLPRPARAVVNAVFDSAWMLLYERPLNAARRELGLPARRGVSMEPFAGVPPMVLACDRALGPAPRTATVDYVQTAAIEPPASGDLSQRTSDFLDERGPVVYLGFGSMQRDPSAMGMLAQLIHDATGSSVLMRGAEAPRGTGSWGMTIGDEPHIQLFPRCALVIHHGGAGTTTAAARAGVPQLVVPHLADQYYWARRVAHLGVGEALPAKTRRPEPVAEAAARVMASDTVRSRASALAASLEPRDGARLTLDALLAEGA